jgi:hypothetical protein
MTPGERIIELFTAAPPPGSNIDWFAEGLLTIAADAPGVALRMVPVPELEPPARRFQVEESGRLLTATGPTFSRVFRPLLARLAVIAAEETGTEFQPYGGRYTLTRTGPDGPARLDVEFSNTPADQHWSAIRTLLSPANGTPTRPATTPAG